MGGKEGERNLGLSITPVPPSPVVCLGPAKGGVALHKAMALAFSALKLISYQFRAGPSPSQMNCPWRHFNAFYLFFAQIEDLLTLMLIVTLE